jgi:2-desacetyl-2-hydroxyethyl bacteriochlorophyllide A dehydrogenase
MRAAVIAGPRRTRVEEVPLPEPGPCEVRVHLEGSGVCASNLGPWEGQTWTAYPLEPGAPGHEGWGRVDSVGRDVRGLACGDRVALVSARAYAEYDVAPAHGLVRLPPALDGRAFPGEALGCAMNIFKRSRIAPGQTVAIVGVGFLGALLTRLAHRAGARVLAISRRPFSLGVARSQGADVVLPFDDPGRVREAVFELTRGRGCERVIEAVGRQSALDLATQLTTEGGVLVIAGYHQDGPRQVDMQLWNWRGLDVVNAHERDPRVVLGGVRMALEAVLSGRIDPFPLFTHLFPLEEVGRALDCAERRPEGFLKGLVVL